jgi:hypothetical protein
MDFLQVTIFPVGVDIVMFWFKGRGFRLHNLTYVDDMKECVAPESKRVLATLPKRGMVPVTTSASSSSPSTSSSPLGIREYTGA